MFFMSLFVNYYMVYKGIGAGIGFALFGDPIITPAWQWLNRNYPNWMELLEPKKYVERSLSPAVKHTQFTDRPAATSSVVCRLTTRLHLRSCV
jgi:hypothetical protein